MPAEKWSWDTSVEEAEVLARDRENAMAALQAARITEAEEAFMRRDLELAEEERAIRAAEARLAACLAVGQNAEVRVVMCVGCRSVLKPAVRYCGHVHIRDLHVIAGWCVVDAFTHADVGMAGWNPCQGDFESWMGLSINGTRTPTWDVHATPVGESAARSIRFPEEKKEELDATGTGNAD